LRNDEEALAHAADALETALELYADLSAREILKFSVPEKSLI